MSDPYREWSYADRVDRSNDPEYRRECQQYDDDRDSGDRAYEEWRSGKDFIDPVPDQRFS